VLFPGCLFAFAGDGDAAGRFLSGAAALPFTGSPKPDWTTLRRYADFYQPARGAGFQVLFSERSAGIPALHRYDPRAGLEGPWRERSITAGTGGLLLDRVVRHHTAVLTDDPAAFTVSLPYAVCLLLSAACRHAGAEAAARAGISGVFHALLQGAEGEHHQRDAVHLIAEGNRVFHFTGLTGHRLALGHDSIAVRRYAAGEDAMVTAGPEVLVAHAPYGRPASPPVQPSIASPERLYDFLGVAPADPAKEGWQVLPWQDPPLFTGEGPLTDTLRVVIDNVLGDTFIEL
jgi:hypothetical protein